MRADRHGEHEWRRQAKQPADLWPLPECAERPKLAARAWRAFCRFWANEWEKSKQSMAEGAREVAHGIEALVIATMAGAICAILYVPLGIVVFILVLAALTAEG